MARSAEEMIAEYDAQLERIRARRQAAVARYGKAERKARTHALCVLGGMLEGCFEGGWKSIDFPAVAALIDGNRTMFAQRTAEALPTVEASRRLRGWEQEMRKEADDDYEASCAEDREEDR